MSEAENAGAFSPGQRVKPIRNIPFLGKSIYDTTCLERGESYLIDKCFDLVWRNDMQSDDKSLERIRLNHALMFANPKILNYRIKLFGFDLVDKFGFEYLLPSNLFVPEWYNI